MKSKKLHSNPYGSLLILALGIGLMVPSTSLATPITASKDGQQIITYTGSDAAHSLTLLHNGNEVFNNKTATVGQKFNLGTFAKGEAINLSIRNNTTGNTFAAGGGNNTFGNSTIAWEDLLGGGDRDFNDLVLLLESLAEGAEVPDALPQGGNPGSSVATPEPTTVILMGSGLLWLAAWRRKKKGTEKSQ